MTSHTTKSFRKLFGELPKEIQEGAFKAYKVWRKDPQHPSLQFKQVHETRPIFSVRIALGWRAVGIKQNDVMIWHWVGSHDDYDGLLKRM